MNMWEIWVALRDDVFNRFGAVVENIAGIPPIKSILGEMYACC